MFRDTNMNGMGRAAGNVLGMGVLVFLLFSSLFTGLMVGAVGGAVYPPVATVAAPWACGSEIEVVSQRYSYKPGQQGVTRNFYCSEPGKERQDITMRVMVHASLLYSAACFVLLICIVLPGALMVKKKAAGLGSQFEDAAASWKVQAKAGQPIVVNLSQSNSNDIEQRLRRLQQLLDQGLITQQDYETKKAELLSQL